MKKNLNRHTISLAIWILQAQLFNLLNAKLLKDENLNYHPIPGTDCMDDVTDNPGILAYAMGYPTNASCTDNILVCSSGALKWGYVNSDDLKNNKDDEVPELKSLYDSIRYLAKDCDALDSVVWCKDPLIAIGKQYCLNKENVDNTCIIDDEPQCKDMDSLFDDNLKQFWSKIMTEEGYNEKYISPTFKTKISITQ
ncbi:MAG: hypothetical protein MHPSP_002784 [Paramarteilia canceri]